MDKTQTVLTHPLIHPFTHLQPGLFKWQVVVDPPGEPEQNMAADAALVQQVRQQVATPILRLYRWRRPAISIGRRQKLEDLPTSLRSSQLPIVRRPTGGGAVVHRLDELTYAVALSSALIPGEVRLSQLPDQIHTALRQELIASQQIHPEELNVAQKDSEGPFSVCFSALVHGDLLFRGRKVTGAALRAWRDVILIQGSIQGLPVHWDALLNATARAVQRGI